MKQFIFATSNSHKVTIAKGVCDEAGVEFEHKPIDLVEIQSDNAEEIALHKVRQAYEKFNEPVAVTDDSWIWPGLNGFPGPYMKYMNQWLTPKDFINLTKDLKDRRAIMRQVIAYKDKDNEKVFVADIEGTLLKEIRGESKIAHFPIISFDGGEHSVAEDEETRVKAIAKIDNAWHQLCDWLKQT
jgi:non-canonical purine NTP pyrophosphatase (RdgB/HAM1 family)